MSGAMYRSGMSILLISKKEKVAIAPEEHPVLFVQATPMKSFAPPGIILYKQVAPPGPYGK